MNKKDGGVKTEKLFNFRPVFFTALSLSLGIIFAFYSYFYGVPVWWAIFLLPFAATPFFFCKTKRKAVQTGIALLALALAFVIGVFGFFTQMENYRRERYKAGEGTVCGRVVEKYAYKKYTGVILDMLKFEGKETNGKLIAYLPNAFYDELEYCDVLMLQGNVRFKELNKEAFSLQANMAGDGVSFAIWTENVAVVGYEFDLFLFLRNRVERTIDAGMDKIPSSVTKALLFGNTTEMDDDLYENVKKGGIAHIFAVSGLHVGALFGFCLLLTKKTFLRKLSKIIRFLFLALLLFTYAGICGFSSSVVRATVICLVAYASSLIGLKTDLLESLGLAGIIILLFKPSSLFEIGFQLSFFACFGIAFLARGIGHVFDEILKFATKPFVKEAVKKKNDEEDTSPLTIGERVYRAVRDFFSASLGAQIFTAPLLLHYFGYVSGWALLLNCLFVPLVSSAFSILLLLVFLACLFSTAIAFVFLYVPNVIWSVVLLILQVFDFSSFCISGLQISVWAMIVYFAGWIFFTDKWNISRFITTVLALSCFIVFMITMVALNI